VVAVLGLVWHYWPSRSAPPPPGPSAARWPQTEAVFAANVKNGDGWFGNEAPTAVLAEWRATRSDHKMITDAIANCESFLSFIRKREADREIDTMPRYAFSALLLDLTPLGAHQFDAADVKVGSNAGTDPKKPTADLGTAPDPGKAADAAKFTFTAYEQAVLTLSDAIARARLAAATAADENINPMRLLGWMTVGLSAFATLLVAIKASMTAPPPKTNAPPTGPKTDAAPIGPNSGKGYRFGFYAIGILAMVVSAGVTVLTGIKQFYDPTTAYKGSEVALIQLTRLHKEVAHDFLRTWNGSTMCAEGRPPEEGKPLDENWKKQKDLTEQLAQWMPVVGKYQAAVVAASANLQEADLAWMTKMDAWPPLSKPPSPPSEYLAPARDAKTGGAADAGVTTKKAAGNAPVPNSTVAAHKNDRKG
jgi:hypothetical protein